MNQTNNNNNWKTRTFSINPQTKSLQITNHFVSKQKQPRKVGRSNPHSRERERERDLQNPSRLVKSSME
jgi:hypothetical protein